LPVGVINTFLSWGFFSPLARISYMAYLIHYDVLMVFFCSADYAFEMSNFVLVIF
jgi:peptidoglycan/LPS O-acetylase OafA/YrhL